MNQGRIWCVVNPTVGLPLFLGSVAGISLIVHASVLSNTTWMSGFWQGAKRQAAEDTTATVATASYSQPAFAITVTPAAASGNGEAKFVVTVTPTVSGQSAIVATAEEASTLALAKPLAK
jgi:light-harvesting protein B-800-850 alpha chain